MELITNERFTIDGIKFTMTMRMNDVGNIVTTIEPEDKQYTDIIKEAGVDAFMIVGETAYIQRGDRILNVHLPLMYTAQDIETGFELGCDLDCKHLRGSLKEKWKVAKFFKLEGFSVSGTTTAGVILNKGDYKYIINHDIFGVWSNHLPESKFSIQHYVTALSSDYVYNVRRKEFIKVKSSDLETLNELIK